MPLLIMIRKNVNQDTIRYLSKSTRLIRFKSLATWFVGGDCDGRKINKCGESAAENHSNTSWGKIILAAFHLTFTLHVCPLKT